MATAPRRMAYWCVKPGCTGYRYIDVAKERGETCCNRCLTPFSAEVVGAGPPAGARRRPGGEQGGGERPGRGRGGYYKPPGGGTRAQSTGAGAGPRQPGLQPSTGHNQLQSRPQAGPRPQGQAPRAGSGAEDGEVQRLRAVLAELEKIFGSGTDETAAVRRRLSEAERAVEEKLSLPQRRDRHRADLEAARQNLAGTFEKVRELGRERRRIERELEQAAETAQEQHEVVKEWEKKVRMLESQMRPPARSGIQIDQVASNMLYEKAKEIECIYRESIRRQHGRELTAEEERNMQIQVYGMSSSLSHPLEEAAESGPTGTPKTDEADMDVSEEGMRNKKSRTRQRTEEEEAARRDSIAREGFDPAEDDISDMEAESDDNQNAYEQLGGEPEVQKLAQILRTGGETTKFLHLRMVKPKPNKGKGKGKEATSPSTKPFLWAERTGSLHPFRPSEEAFPPLQEGRGAKTGTPHTVSATGQLSGAGSATTGGGPAGIMPPVQGIPLPTGRSSSGEAGKPMPATPVLPAEGSGNGQGGGSTD